MNKEDRWMLQKQSPVSELQTGDRGDSSRDTAVFRPVWHRAEFQKAEGVGGMHSVIMSCK